MFSMGLAEAVPGRQLSFSFWPILLCLLPSMETDYKDTLINTLNTEFLLRVGILMNPNS